jgi:hypothetical protein
MKLYAAHEKKDRTSCPFFVANFGKKVIKKEKQSRPFGYKLQIKICKANASLCV